MCIATVCFPDFDVTFEPKLMQQLPILHKRTFSGKFHFIDLYLFIVPYHTVKFEKKSLEWILS